MWNERTNEIIDWICLIMLIVGTIGNLLGIIVFSSQKFRRTRYGRIALISFIVNILCVYRYSLLIHSKSRLWITFYVGQSWLACKLYRLSSCLRILSAFILVTWTYERFVYITTHSSTNHFFQKYKFYFLSLIYLIIIGCLTGPNVYFYHQISLIPSKSSFEENQTNLFSSNRENSNWRKLRGICGLKDSVSLSWQSFLIDVRFGLNYTTLRSIFSEIIPSMLVLLFDIGIILHVIQSDWQMSFHSPSTSSRPSFRNSFQSKDFSPSTLTMNGGLIVHNRPRTSWMNIGLIIHSSIFCFSSLTSTIIHWTTSNVLLSYWSSVLILGNSSFYFYIYCLTGKSFRNEIQKIFYRYFQIYFFGKCFNLCRTEEEREDIEQTIHMRLIRHRSTIIPPQSIAHLRRPSAFL